jgi:predicted alpha-1,2-mannosidase
MFCVNCNILALIYRENTKKSARLGQGIQIENMNVFHSMFPRAPAPSHYFRINRALCARTTAFLAALSCCELFLWALNRQFEPPWSLSVASSVKPDLLPYVDPMIGSGGHGHVFIGANTPFGMVQVGPSQFNRGWDWSSGYHYSANDIIGFPQTHLSGAGISELGDILIQPYVSDRLLFNFQMYGSRFSHSDETVSPGYYSVFLDNFSVWVELTATDRCGFHRYRFPPGNGSKLVMDLSEGNGDGTDSVEMQQLDNQTWLGYRVSHGWAYGMKVAYAFTVDKPPDQMEILWNRKMILSWNDSPGTLLLKIGISPNTPEKALHNLRCEIPGWDFEGTLSLAQSKWRNILSRITVQTPNKTILTVFYTAFYHSLIHPSLYSDCGEPDNYSTFSLWDTYRAAHPLYTILFPSRVSDFIATFLDEYKWLGTLPVWPLWGQETKMMVGISSFQVICEAILKGIPNIDVETAYNAMLDVANSSIRGLEYHRELKNLPAETSYDSISQSFELSVGDGCISLLAAKLGKTKTAEYFAARARNYRLYWDPTVEFFRGRNSNGTFHEPWDAMISGQPASRDYTEGNAYSYLFFAPQDVSGLIQVLGGETAFSKRLDEFFTTEMPEGKIDDLSGLIGQYAHGNEHSHHILYLYAYTGEQWKIPPKVRHVLDHFYSTAPDGIIGNEDCGQMSSWYILSAIGFYPVFPASLEYVFGTPALEYVALSLEDGKVFVVKAPGTSAENCYIQKVQLNGRLYTKAYIRHEDIMAGGELFFEMGSQPNKEFGSKPEDRPNSSMG